MFWRGFATLVLGSLIAIGANLQERLWPSHLLLPQNEAEARRMRLIEYVEIVDFSEEIENFRSGHQVRVHFSGQGNGGVNGGPYERSRGEVGFGHRTREMDCEVLYVRHVEGNDQLEAEERDLIARWNPSLNTHHRTVRWAG